MKNLGKTLAGQRVLVTRAAHQNSRTAELLRNRGAEPVLVPTIAVVAPPDPEPLRKAVQQLENYQVVAFTSGNGVSWFWSELERQGRDGSVLATATIAAIGPGTEQALRERGVTVHIVQEPFIAERLAEGVIAYLEKQAEQGPEPPRVLLPRALVAREVLPTKLREAGVQVDVVPVYQTVRASDDRRDQLHRMLEAGKIDIVMLTSSSTVENLCALLGPRAAELLATTIIASIGPITTESAERLGLKVALTARQSTINGLVDALGAYLQSRFKSPPAARQ